MGIMGTFDGFSAIRLGIFASQKGLNLTGHNISNINTPGFTRQVVDQYSLVTKGSSMYYSQMDAHVGNGVYIRSISQIRDPYLDIRFRTENSSVGALTRKSEGLQSLASVIDEVMKGQDENGLLGAQFSDFLDKLMNLTQFTSQEEYDAQVKASADALVKLFNQSASRLNEVEKNAKTAFTQDIETVNNILMNIRDLNESIRISGIHGDGALEQRDERNRLIDELSSYLKIDVIYSMEDLGGGLEVEKLTIRLANANPDPSVETDSSVLIDGIYGTQLCSPKLSDAYKEYLSIIDEYNADMAKLSADDTDEETKKALITKYSEKFYLDLSTDDDDAIKASIEKLQNLYPNGEFPADQFKYLKKNGEGTNRIQDAALSFDDNPNYDLTLSQLESSSGKKWENIVSSNTTVIQKVQVSGNDDLVNDTKAAEEKLKDAINKEFGNVGVYDALMALQKAYQDLDPDDPNTDAALTAAMNTLTGLLGDNVTVTPGDPPYFTVTSQSGNVVTEKTIAFHETNTMSKYTLQQYRDMAKKYQDYLDKQNAVNTAKTALAQAKKNLEDAIAADPTVDTTALDAAVATAQTNLSTAQRDLAKAYPNPPTKVEATDNTADPSNAYEFKYGNGNTPVTFSNTAQPTDKAVMSTSYSRVETVRQYSVNETQLDDNDLYGALQAARELLTEDGEFSSMDTIENVDENAATKRGIPYYRKALDLLANKFAEEYNRANTGFMIDQNHNYVRAVVDANGEPVLDENGKPTYETIKWPDDLLDANGNPYGAINRYTTIEQLTKEQKNFLATQVFVKGDTSSMTTTDATGNSVNVILQDGKLILDDGQNTEYDPDTMTLLDANGQEIDKDGNLLDEDGNPITVMTEDPDNPSSQVELNKQLETALRQYISEQGGIPAENGGPLFSNRGDGDDTTGITAGNISVSASWANKSTQIVASYVMVFGDNPGTTANENVLHMGSLMDTAHHFFANSIVSDAVSKDIPLFRGSFQEMLVGIQATLADDQYTTAIRLNNHYESALELDMNRDFTSGVDLNDETANMMQFQKAYSAACRVMTALDEAIDRLVNNTGVVGR